MADSVILTLAEAQARDKRVGAGTEWEAIVTAACDWVRAYTGRSFLQVEYTEYHDTVLGKLYVDEPPIAALPLIAIYDTADLATALTADSAIGEDDGDYCVRLAGVEGSHVIMHGHYQNSGYGLKVVYTGGYEIVPDAIKEAATMAVIAIATGKDLMGLQSTSQGGVSQSAASDPFMSARALLARYRRFPV